jgi:hypothetical protein
VTLAQAINTEKSRSKLIIINVLLEAKMQLLDRISLLFISMEYRKLSAFLLAFDHLAKIYDHIIR